MLIRPNIMTMFHSLNAKHFDGKVPVIPVVWNNRMTTTAGYCRYKYSGNSWSRKYTVTKIDLSDKLFCNSNYDVEKIEQTLIHEMVHAFLIANHNEPGHS